MSPLAGSRGTSLVMPSYITRVVMGFLSQYFIFEYCYPCIEPGNYIDSELIYRAGNLTGYVLGERAQYECHRGHNRRYNGAYALPVNTGGMYRCRYPRHIA